MANDRDRQLLREALEVEAADPTDTDVWFADDRAILRRERPTLTSVRTYVDFSPAEALVDIDGVTVIVTGKR